jgi:hypothetical protein
VHTVPGWVRTRLNYDGNLYFNPGAKLNRPALGRKWHWDEIFPDFTKSGIKNESLYIEMPFLPRSRSCEIRGVLFSPDGVII